MADKSNIIVTGDKKLDVLLANLEPKMQRKAIKKATRESAKLFKNRLKPTVPKDSGAMADAIQVRATTKSIKKGTGVFKEGTAKNGFKYTFQVKKIIGKDFGAKIEITRKSLAKQLAKRGLHDKADKVMKGKYFYPAMIELGGRKRAADAPFRRTLRQQRMITMGVFRAYLAKFLANPK